jgi:hypothetical protein
MDHQRRFGESYSSLNEVIDNGDLPHEEIDRKIKRKGMFILLSSECVEVSEVLPLYYMHQLIEQIFDLHKMLLFPR